jgi:peptidoglycan/xylan/chitin deacetylase (PgdA/CDA1 family)
VEPGPARTVSGGPGWPRGARGALSLSFDNLGEAAEIALGAIPADDGALGDHFTARRVLPSLLDQLDRRDIAATFFVEGLNTELYPDALAEIDARGHELGYHSWCHEQWGDLTAADQAANLDRGLGAFGELGLELSGFRPPGGGLGSGGLDVLREAGLRYCSPAGSGAGEIDGIALIPFQWRHVDASCVLPPLASVRKLMTGSTEPLAPTAFLSFLDAETARLAVEGGQIAIVLHLSMADWLGEAGLDALLDRIAGCASRDELWVARSGAVAEHVLARVDAFRGRTVLDPTSWTDGG